MANKENELTCPEKVQAIHYNDNCMFPVNSAAEVGSKMAGPGYKYSDYFTELSKDHDAMTHVLFGRNLRLNVALTLWRRNASELVAYLIRIEDTGVLLDCLPVITKRHLIVVLHWVQSVVKKWWPELSTNGKPLLDSCSEDRNLQVMKQQLKEFWVEGPQLSLVPGTTGEMAKAIESYLSQLH
ncbi:KATNB1-like protein 1 isoform X2 [Salvelinus namaycush]|uniref:KATNB1-like protein 1 isoform X2 n=1 Tax=Salvelinus namaycush TaxID=8040 RepID=A0A8U0QDL9_SALNM|nr:KATNB1-like protein 1 isoform X2 [Salvelinus namaycush]